MKPKKNLYDFVLGDLRPGLNELANKEDRSYAYLIRKAVKALLVKEGIIIVEKKKVV